VTLNLVLKASIRSASSTTVLLPIASMIWSFVMVVIFSVLVVQLRGFGLTLFAKRFEGADHLIEHPVEGAGKLSQQCVARGQLAQALHVGRIDGLTIHQTDPDLGLLMLPGEVADHLGR